MALTTGPQLPLLEHERRDVMNARYYPRPDAARYLGISIRKVDELAASRKLPRIRIGGRVLFDLDDFNRLMDGNRQS